MITKKEFIDIINKLKQVNDFVDETNEKAKKLNDAIITDFFNASSLSISHENIVVKLLENIFNNDSGIISWWLYELDYGKKFKQGYLRDENGDIDVSTPDKLYDYLIKWSDSKIDKLEDRIKELAKDRDYYKTLYEKHSNAFIEGGKKLTED